MASVSKLKAYCCGPLSLYRTVAFTIKSFGDQKEVDKPVVTLHPHTIFANTEIFSDELGCTLDSNNKPGITTVIL